MEHRICGDPEISVEALKKSTHYDDLNATDQRVLHLWEAMEKWVEFECGGFRAVLFFLSLLSPLSYVSPLSLSYVSPSLLTYSYAAISA